MPTAEMEAVAARIPELAAELRDMIVLLARLSTDDGDRTSLDALLDRYGLTRADLDTLPDED